MVVDSKTINMCKLVTWTKFEQFFFVVSQSLLHKFHEIWSTDTKLSQRSTVTRLIKLDWYNRRNLRFVIHLLVCFNVSLVCQIECKNNSKQTRNGDNKDHDTAKITDQVFDISASATNRFVIKVLLELIFALQASSAGRGQSEFLALLTL